MKTLFSTILSLFIVTPILAQPIQTVLDDAFGTSLVQTQDGGFAIAGNAFSSGLGSPYLVKLNSEGQLQWTNVIWNSNFSVPSSLLQTNDGGYLFSGKQLIKFDNNGAVQWYRWEYGGQAIQTSDHGFLLTGSDLVMDSTISQAAQILKIDSGAEFQWQFAFRDTQLSGAKSQASMAIELWDGYLIGGTHSGQTHTGESPMIFLVKLSLTGQLIWERNLLLHSPNPAYFSRMILTADGGIAVVGTTIIQTPFKRFDGDVLYIKCNNIGIPEWTLTLDALANESAIGLVETPDGSLIAASSTTIDSVAGILLTTVSANGDLKKVSRVHFKEHSLKPYAMIPLPSKRLLLTGIFQSHTNGMFVLSSDAFCSEQDILVQTGTPEITVDSAWTKDTIRLRDRQDVFYTTLQSAVQTDFCSLVADVNESTTASSAISVSPNPIVYSDPIILYCSRVNPGYYEVSLYDALGRELYHEKRYLAGAEEKIKIQVSDMPTGIYTVELLDADSFTSVWRGKLVKMR